MSTADKAGDKPARAGWPKRLLRSLGALTGLLAFGVGTTAAPAQSTDYRAVAAAPASWQAFAQQLQGRFQQRMAADDKEARAFQDEIAKRGSSPDAASLKVTVRTWVSPDGKVERLAFGASDDSDIAAGLRALLTGVQVGSPPADMLQPLQLRMSLRPKDERAGGN